MSIKVVYKDIALGADKNAVVSYQFGKEDFSDADSVTTGGENPAIATFETNSWGLTHDIKVREDTQNVGYWSIGISQSSQSEFGDAVFFGHDDHNPILTLDFSELYTSTGLTITFAPATYEACSFAVEYYRGDVLISALEDNSFNPIVELNNTVEAFDKIVFSFKKSRLPFRRIKIDNITIGVNRVWNEDELKNVSVINEADLSSETLPINIVDCSIHAKQNADYLFQRKQPVEVYDGNTLIGTYYVQEGERLSERDYTLSCQDALGILELSQCKGGIWIENTPLTEIINTIFGKEFVFDIHPAFAKSMLKGFIEPEITKREALAQIAFALGAVVDTSGTEKIKIIPMSNNSGTIDPRKTYDGGKITTADKVTEVTVTAYRFFDERPEENDEYIEINGVQYRYYTETKHARNPEATASDPENVKKFIGFYLCSIDNAQQRADELMNFFSRRDTYSFSHVLTDEKTAGEYTVDLPWGNPRTGNVAKMTIKMSGIVVSDTEMIMNE